MDIVLDAKFNNPFLPKVPLPGFFDDFGPLGGPVNNSSLGATSREKRSWEYNTSPWARTSDYTAASPRGTRLVAHVNGLRSNGTLTSTIHTLTTTGQYGIAFRYIDTDNYNYFAYNAAEGYFFVGIQVDGVRETIGGVYTPEAPLAPGDKITVTMQGTEIYSYHNSDEAIFTSSDANKLGTDHGLFTHVAEAQFDDIEFIPS